MLADPEAPPPLSSTTSENTSRTSFTPPVPIEPNAGVFIHSPFPSASPLLDSWPRASPPPRSTSSAPCPPKPPPPRWSFSSLSPTSRARCRSVSKFARTIRLPLIPLLRVYAHMLTLNVFSPRRQHLEAVKPMVASGTARMGGELDECEALPLRIE